MNDHFILMESQLHVEHPCQIIYPQIYHITMPKTDVKLHSLKPIELELKALKVAVEKLHLVPRLPSSLG